MKTDKSIRNITLAAINRSVMDMNDWIYSRIVEEDDTDLTSDFKLANNELGVFEIKSPNIHTLVTTRQILEKHNGKIRSIEYCFIDDIIFGDFKGRPNKPELSKFRIVHLHGDEIDFQMETGKASIGLIKSVKTIRRLRNEACT